MKADAVNEQEKEEEEDERTEEVVVSKAQILTAKAVAGVHMRFRL